MSDDYKQYKNLINTLDLGVLFINDQGIITYANKKASRILAISKAKTATIFDEYEKWKACKEDGTLFSKKNNPFLTSILTGVEVKDEVIGIVNLKTENTHWLKLSSTSESKKIKNKPSKVYITFSDITELKSTHEHLKHFKLAVESSTNAIGLSTPDGKHFYQNKAFDKLFGRISEDPPTSLYFNENIGREVFDTIKKAIHGQEM